MQKRIFLKIEHFKAFVLMLIGAESIHLVYEPVLDSTDATMNRNTEDSENSRNRGCNSCESRHKWYEPRKRKILLFAGSFFAISGIIILTAVIAFKSGVIDDFNHFRKRYEPITEEDFLGAGENDVMKVGSAWMLRNVFKRNLFDISLFTIELLSIINSVVHVLSLLRIFASTLRPKATQKTT